MADLRAKKLRASASKRNVIENKVNIKKSGYSILKTARKTNGNSLKSILYFYSSASYSMEESMQKMQMTYFFTVFF